MVAGHVKMPPESRRHNEDNDTYDERGDRYRGGYVEEAKRPEECERECDTDKLDLGVSEVSHIERPLISVESCA